MQDRFVGDIGDFGKYGLLRALTSPQPSDGKPALSLGVLWYLTTDDLNPPGAGKFTDYLSRPEEFRSCDEPLFDALGKIVRSNRRSVTSVRDSGILPSVTVFYEVPLDIHGNNATPDSRLAHRKQWVTEAHRLTEDCDMVFVDPDIGLEVGTRPQHKAGPKYVFYEELLPCVRRNQSIVIYQHSDHTKPIKDQIGERISQIKRWLGAGVVIPLLFRRWALRTFFLLPSERHSDILLRRVDNLLEGPWCHHFKLAG